MRFDRRSRLSVWLVHAWDNINDPWGEIRLYYMDLAIWAAVRVYSKILVDISIVFCL